MWSCRKWDVETCSFLKQPPRWFHYMVQLLLKYPNFPCQWERERSGLQNCFCCDFIALQTSLPTVTLNLSRISSWNPDVWQPWPFFQWLSKRRLKKSTKPTNSLHWFTEAMHAEPTDFFWRISRRLLEAVSIFSPPVCLSEADTWTGRVCHVCCFKQMWNEAQWVMHWTVVAIIKQTTFSIAAQAQDCVFFLLSLWQVKKSMSWGCGFSVTGPSDHRIFVRLRHSESLHTCHHHWWDKSAVSGVCGSSSCKICRQYTNSCTAYEKDLQLGATELTDCPTARGQLKTKLFIQSNKQHISSLQISLSHCLLSCPADVWPTLRCPGHPARPIYIPIIKLYR